MVNSRHKGVLLSAGLFVALFSLLIWSATNDTLGAQEKSLLWQVSRDGKSIFLLGSIHYLRKENYPLSETILKALDASKRLVLEIDLNRISAEAAQKTALEKAIYRDGTTLAQNVSPETYDLAARRATELGLDMRILNPMKPWFAALTMVAINLHRMGLDAKLGVDRHLAERAKNSSKPTAGLETLEAQLLGRNIDQIVQAWLTGDDNRLAALLLAGKQEYPDLYDKLVVERNRRWLGDIEKLLEQGGGAMVVVGAAHLVGKDSVVEMLKVKGYRLEQR